MNHDKLRQQAEATLSNAGSSAEYILASAVLALLDENAALRSAIQEHLEDCPLHYEQEMDVDGMPYSFSLRKALGDAS